MTEYEPQPLPDEAFAEVDRGQPVEGELLTATSGVWVGHLIMEAVRTVALVVMAVALVVIA